MTVKYINVITKETLTLNIEPYSLNNPHLMSQDNYEKYIQFCQSNIIERKVD